MYRIRPDTCARISCPFSSVHRNRAFGSFSFTVASTTIGSSFAIGSRPFEEPLHPGGDLLDRPARLDLPQDGAAPVELDEARLVAAMDGEPLADDLRGVVGAAQELPPAAVAPPLDLRGPERHVVGGPARPAGAAPRHPLEDRLVREEEAQRPVERRALPPAEPPLERPRLRLRPGEPVEEEARPAVGGGEPVEEELEDEGVRDE